MARWLLVLNFSAGCLAVHLGKRWLANGYINKTKLWIPSSYVSMTSDKRGAKLN